MNNGVYSGVGGGGPSAARTPGDNVYSHPTAGQPPVEQDGVEEGEGEVLAANPLDEGGCFAPDPEAPAAAPESEDSGSAARWLRSARAGRLVSALLGTVLVLMLAAFFYAMVMADTASGKPNVLSWSFWLPLATSVLLGGSFYLFRQLHRRQSLVLGPLWGMVLALTLGVALSVWQPWAHLRLHESLRGLMAALIFGVLLAIIYATLRERDHQ